MREAVASVSVAVMPALAVVLASCAGVAAPPAGGTEVTSSFEAMASGADWTIRAGESIRVTNDSSFRGTVTFRIDPTLTPP